MWKKIVIVTLVLTITGAAAVALWDNRSSFDPAVAHAQDDGSPAAPPISNDAAAAPERATASTGEPWAAEAEVVAVDDTGMTVQLDDGSEIYVELGQPAFWQAQGVPLAAGDRVSISGFDNAGQIHASTVATVDGGTLQLRSASGQPLWAGGQQQVGADKPAGTEPVAVENWQTFTGTVSAVTRGGLTVQREDGISVVLQLGRSDFWQSQNVALAAGDLVAVQGFIQGEQFQAAQVTKVATGERILLRDPNGRPLWGGPGRNGKGGQGRGQAGGQVDQTAATQTTTLEQ